MSLFRQRFRGHRLRDFSVRDSYSNPRSRRQYVTFMFDLLAPGYDLFTRWFSFGMDQNWKRLVVERATSGLPPHAAVVDLACGTGEIARALAARHPDRAVLGIDLSAEMLVAAHAARSGSGAVDYARGDICALPLPDRSVERITIGYGFRNLPDFRAGITETARVLKPGGKMVVLDFFKPRRSLWRSVFLGYLHLAGSLGGWIWHNDASTFNYIAYSVEHFVGLDEFVRCLESAGFKTAGVHPRLGGGIAIVEAERLA